MLEGDASTALSPVSPRIRESVERGTFVENLKEVRLRSSREALQVLARGANNRRTASTFMNATSSRSHAVFIIRIEQVTPASPSHRRKGKVGGGERVCTSSLSLVDLAGSERQQKASNAFSPPEQGAKGTSATGAGTSPGTGSSALVEATDFLSSTGRSTPSSSLPGSFRRPRASRWQQIRESRELMFDDDDTKLPTDQGCRSFVSSRPTDRSSRSLLCRTDDVDALSDGTETDCEELSSFERMGEPAPRRLSASVPQSPLPRRHSESGKATPKGWDILKAAGLKPTRSATASPMGHRRNSLGSALTPPDDGSRLQEACAINKSLSALSGVIIALNEDRPYIPYRDSKLTLLLRESIGGSSRTWMVANVSPLETCMTETLSTIMYAQKPSQRVLSPLSSPPS